MRRSFIALAPFLLIASSHLLAANWYASTVAQGSANGTNWANAWAYTAVSWASIQPGDTLYLDGGSTSLSYGNGFTVGKSGTDDTNRITVMIGQDAGHNGTAVFSGAIVFSNRNYVTIDGGVGGAIHLQAANITAQTTTSPVIRYLKLDGGSIDARYGFHGLFQHLFIDNGSGDNALTFSARNDKGGPNEVHAYDDIIVEDSHIVLCANATENGTGADGIQGAPGLTVRNNLIETKTSGCTVGTNHMDFVQVQAYWFSAYGNVFKDSADSVIDYDGFNGSAPTHFRIFNNVFIKNRGGADIRFYGGLDSLDEIHIVNNTIVDHACCVYEPVAIYGLNTGATVSNSEIKNNIFYNNTLNEDLSLRIDASTGWTAADWNVDYNLVNTSGVIKVDGATYTQAHGKTCAPAFAGYVFDSVASDLHLASGDTCAKDAGTPVTSLTTIDKDGNTRTAPWDMGAYEYAAAPIVSLAPASLTFSSQSVDSTSAAQSITLQNTGNASLTISSIAASGDFARTTTCGASLAASASCTISVTFTPTSTGTRTGAITVTDNAAGSPHSVTLSGTGAPKYVKYGRGSGTGSFRMGAGPTVPGPGTLESYTIPGILPAEPAYFVDMRAPDAGEYDAVKTVKTSDGDYADLQAALNAWAAAADQKWHILVDPDVTSSYNAGLVLPSKTGATKWVIVESSDPPAPNTTVCSGGWQDNLPGAYKVYHRDYQCPTDRDKLYKVTCTVSPCAPVSSGEDGSGQGAHHILIRHMEAYPSASIAGVKSNFQIGTGDTDLAKIPAYIGIEQSYVHGDATDGGFSGNNVIANSFLMNCHDCWLAYNYADRSIRPGGEGHGVLIGYGYRIKIVRNVIEGHSSGFFCGGSPAAPGYPAQACTDLEVGQNRWTYPAAWLGATGTSCSGQSCVRKNASELKTGLRWLAYGNIFENVDNSGGQSGVLFISEIHAYDPWMRDEDGIVRGNIFRNGCVGTQNSAHSGDASTSIGYGMNRRLFVDNLFYHMGSSLTGCSNVAAPYVHTFGAQDAPIAFSACTNLRDASGINSTITCPSSEGYTQTDVSVGDMIHIDGCADSTFSNSTLHALGFRAIAPTDPTALAITYANAGTPNASTTGCILHTASGWGRNLTHIHETQVAPGINNVVTGDCASASTTPWLYAENFTFQSNLVIGNGFIGAGGSCATPTNFVTRAFNTENEIFNYQVYPGLSGASYTEVLNGVTSSPPSTIYFPTQVHCSGATPDATCLGLKGFMSGTTINANAADWHDYALLPSSLFAKGQSKSGANGEQMGANFTNIDILQTADTYPCLHAGCGATPNTH